MHERLTPMLAELREHASDFESGATAILRAVMDVAERTCAAHEGATVLRAMVHHRPADGYRRLAVMDREADAVTLTGVKEAFLPSATAWRWIVENRQPASIDVNLALIQTERPDGPQPTTDPGLLGTGSTSHDSRLRLLRRGATHVYVVPLFGLRGSVDGLVSIEAHCPSAVGAPFGWSVCAKDIEVLAALAAPFVSELPLRRSHERATDALLPVAGEAMMGLVRILRVFRDQRETILIGGPTGSGKSRLARWCHTTSSRSGGPFEVLDLASVPEELQMGELFGWRKGAFTGALRDNPGALGRAEGGTLFIDEIDKLSLRAQAGLLHVLEERAYRPLGDTGPERAANVRFFAGTNTNLLEAVRTKRLREDLYYRVNVLPVQLPELDARRDEIPGWASYMAQRRHEETAPGGRAVVTAEGTKLLGHSSWPGNLRQLDNIVRRAYALAMAELGGETTREITIDVAHLRSALAYEIPASTSSGSAEALPAILAAASAFHLEAKRRQRDGAVLDLDLAEAFKGFVLAAALEDAPADRDGVFTLFGKPSLVKSRNHHKVLRREIERADALSQMLAPTARLGLLRLLDEGEDGPGGG